MGVEARRIVPTRPLTLRLISQIPPPPHTHTQLRYSRNGGRRRTPLLLPTGLYPASFQPFLLSMIHRSSRSTFPSCHSTDLRRVGARHSNGKPAPASFLPHGGS